MKYRVHKETSQFNVLPLFKSSILVNPSLKHINSYIFALEMQNTQPNLSLDITQISSVSSSWFIQPFNSFHSFVFLFLFKSFFILFLLLL